MHLRYLLSRAARCPLPALVLAAHASTPFAARPPCSCSLHAPPRRSLFAPAPFTRAFRCPRPCAVRCPPLRRSLSTPCPPLLHSLPTPCPPLLHSLPTPCPPLLHSLPTPCPPLLHSLPAPRAPAPFAACAPAPFAARLPRSCLLHAPPRRSSLPASRARARGTRPRAVRCPCPCAVRCPPLALVPAPLRRSLPAPHARCPLSHAVRSPPPALAPCRPHAQSLLPACSTASPIEYKPNRLASTGLANGLEDFCLFRIAALLLFAGDSPWPADRRRHAAYAATQIPFRSNWSILGFGEDTHWWGTSVQRALYAAPLPTAQPGSAIHAPFRQRSGVRARTLLVELLLGENTSHAIASRGHDSLKGSGPHALLPRPPQITHIYPCTRTPSPSGSPSSLMGALRVAAGLAHYRTIPNELPAQRLSTSMLNSVPPPVFGDGETPKAQAHFSASDAPRW
ncbi:hypothetical protein DFH08DRAFT_979591 [Mycena albidolilacea]|uniref:Uncharacterized protein n=1 Tax=Mycena albidolilacea TaxID=1033008 RepID=A0AAD7E6Z8_9AGAR|nr:hypothetical protein DFH08DRAFT_979591 [Mycena albidolilacea]